MPDLLARRLERGDLDLLARLHDVGRRLERRHLLRRLLHARQDQRLEGIARVVAQHRDDRRLGNPVQDLQLDVDLLQIRREALGRDLARVLLHVHAADLGDEGQLEPEARREELVRHRPERDAHAALARLDHVGAPEKRREREEPEDEICR